MKVFCQKIVFVSIVVFFLGCDKSEVSWNIDPADWDYSNYGEINDGTTAIASEPQGTEIQRVYEPRATQRVQTIGWYPESELKGPEDELLFRPVAMHIDDEERLMYLHDAGVSLLKTFSLIDGEHLLSFGNGTGQGPGEYSSPFDFTVMPDNSVLITDRSNARVIHFDESGEILDHIKHEFQISGAKTVDNEHYIGYMSRTDYELFGLFDMSGNLIKKFGRLVNDLNLKPGMIGDFRADSKGNFVYTMTNSGHMLGYNSHQELTFYRTSITQEPFPTFIKATVAGTQRGAYAFDMSKNHASYRMLNLWKNEFFVQIIPKKGFPDYSDDRIAIIDAFSIEDGSYLYSVEWPIESCGMFFITDESLYTNCIDEGIVEWERPSAVNFSTHSVE